MVTVVTLVTLVTGGDVLIVVTLVAVTPDSPVPNYVLSRCSHRSKFSSHSLSMVKSFFSGVLRARETLFSFLVSASPIYLLCHASRSQVPCSNFSSRCAIFLLFDSISLKQWIKFFLRP
jgi:hypothetical protein